MREDTGRKPTEPELIQLKEYYRSAGQDEETVDKIIQNSWFMVFDTNHSPRPAYEGKLIVAVYGMPEFYELLHLKEHTIQRIIFYNLNLEQSIQLTSTLHAAITQYLERTLGLRRKTRVNKNKDIKRTVL
jgi:hypothetical protein